MLRGASAAITMATKTSTPVVWLLLLLHVVCGQNVSSTSPAPVVIAPASTPSPTPTRLRPAPHEGAHHGHPGWRQGQDGPGGPHGGHQGHQGHQNHHCPNRCICFKTVVRCMFLHLDHVPHIPPDTTTLDLRFNNIKEIHADTFKDLKNLQTLLLNNNHLIRLQRGAFNGLSKLRYLYLYRNRIRELDSDVFKDLGKLEHFTEWYSVSPCSSESCQLLCINSSITNFSQLPQFLPYLHYNDIENVSSDSFSNLRELSRLYLHYNKIDRIPGLAFLELRKLERLFLHYNKLHTIPAGAFRNLGSLRRLRLDSNMLSCDCNALWLARMLQDKEDTHSSATCASPPALQGRALADLRDADFHCSKPKIVKEPEDVEINYQGPVYFTCKAEGDPEPRIIWLKEGTEEVNPSDPGYSLMKDGTLMVEKPLTHSASAYACVAKSTMGEVKSRVAKMITSNNMEKPDIRRPPRDWEVSQGDRVTLDCGAVGFPPPRVSWTFKGRDVSTAQGVQLSSDGTLSLLSVERAQAGEYRCTATNPAGSVSATARVVVRVAPRFITRPNNLTLKIGGTAVMICRVDAAPTSALSWFRDGRALSSGGRITISDSGEELRIDHVKESDSGKYTCRAQNSAGSSETSAQLSIFEHSSKVVLVHHPYNMEVMATSSVELPCSAEGTPPPVITWTKNGYPVQPGNRFRVSKMGSLRIYNVSADDAGDYECMASNGFYSASGKGSLSVKADSLLPGPGNPGDRFVRVAFGEASLAVDRAVNATLSALFSRQSAQGVQADSHSQLFRLIRYPDAKARQLARAADVYEKTLINIRRHVEAGLKLNLTQDFNYNELLSQSQLEAVANLSGCMTHRPVINCSDLCFHFKYRSIDGTCNNLQHPMWGASLTGFRRVLHSQYENGFSTPIGWNKNIKYFGFSKPSARLVSTSIISTNSTTPDSKITHMVMQWGQFLDHDLDHAIPSETSTSWDGIDCKKSCDYAAPCYPIEIPPNDPRVRNRRCIDFVRSSAICGSGQTSVFFDTVQTREQINQLTSFVDASQVYGFTDEQAFQLRNTTNDYGRLREGPTYEFSRKPYLPFPSPGEAMDCRRDPAESDIRCFLAGDIRANEQVGLLAMHTLWFREHNRIAHALRGINPFWDGDTIYHEARKIVGAQAQHITFKHWLPIILGEKGMEMLGPYQGYDPNVQPSVSNVFATAALRFGHSLINPQLHRLNESFEQIPEGHLALGKAFFSPWRLVVEGGVDPLLRGLIHTPAKLKTPQENLNSELTEQLFTVAHAVALDLAAINIQRGRDHGIPPYNAWRAFCNMPEAESFDDLRNEISSQAVRDKLKELYGHPGNIDVFVGGILEDQVDGAKVGPTFRCLLVEQFKRLRDGDRFYYENPSVFKPEQLTQIKQSSLARIICDNSDNIHKVQKDVFVLENKQQPNGYLTCDSFDIPRVDLRFWSECCQDCRSSTSLNSIARGYTNTYRRSRRDVSYPEDRPVTATPLTGLHNVTLPTSSVSTHLPLDSAENDIDTTLLGLDDDIGEERIEGLESVLESFQKTIKQLRRKVRRLEEHCQRRGGGPPIGGGGGHCRDADGRRRKNDEEWQLDTCTHCVCKTKNITCTKLECPSLTCAQVKTVPGQCCPVCK